MAVFSGEKVSKEPTNAVGISMAIKLLTYKKSFRTPEKIHKTRKFTPRKIEKERRFLCFVLFIICINSADKCLPHVFSCFFFSRVLAPGRKKFLKNRSYPDATNETWKSI